MITRLAGAAIRALFVIILIAAPSLILPGTTADVSQIVTLVALFAAALTFFEYASTYPGLVEFRDAPPFNRIRFGSLFLTVVLLGALGEGRRGCERGDGRRHCAWGHNRAGHRLSLIHRFVWLC